VFHGKRAISKTQAKKIGGVFSRQCGIVYLIFNFQTHFELALVERKSVACDVPQTLQQGHLLCLLGKFDIF
jgi:hypothetical protein